MIIGIDEVGRGCWAGPLVAGAVRLFADVHGLTDSKLLTAKKREVLAEQIYLNAEVSLGWVTASEVDAMGLTEAVRCAMQRAADGLTSGYSQIIIDGNINYLQAYPLTQAVIKADLTEPCVSAASIVAKVARDAYMRELAQKYPMYGFEKHVGYGTKQHVAALQLHGVTNEHRKSYKPVAAFI